MMIFQRRQIIVVSLLLMILVAGALQYGYRKSSLSGDKDAGKNGEPVFVDGSDTSTETDTSSIATSDQLDTTKPEEDVTASKYANNYFAEAKINKEISRNNNTDALKKITEDENATKQAKEDAYEQMRALIANSEKEMKVEQLIKERGFNDAVAFFGDDGSIDIVIKAPSLTAQETAQISDIVSRQADIPMEMIHIRHLF